MIGLRLIPSYIFLFYFFLFLLLVFSEHLDLLHQWGDGIDALAIAGQVIKGEIHVEEIFPLMPDVRQRLNLCEIDVVEAQDGEHLGERALVVGEAEDDARLVGLLYRAKQGCLLRIAAHEESGIVVRIVVDALLQHLHAIHLGCIARADGCPSMHLVLGDIGCRTCGILCLHSLEVGMVGQKLTTLHQSHWVGMHLL